MHRTSTIATLAVVVLLALTACGGSEDEAPIADAPPAPTSRPTWTPLPETTSMPSPETTPTPTVPAAQPTSNPRPAQSRDQAAATLSAAFDQTTGLTAYQMD